MLGLFRLFIAFLPLCCGSLLPICSADDGTKPIDAKTQKAMKDHMKAMAKKAAKEKYKTVPEAIENIEFFNGTPDKKAKHYIYLHSASWCGPCRAIMPKIIEQYPDMKKGKVEIILIGYDQTEDAALNYIQHYSSDIAGITVRNSNSRRLPGFSSADKGIPHATVVDRKGKVLYNGPAGAVVNWKNIIKKK